MKEARYSAAVGMHHLSDPLSDPSTPQRVALPLGYMHITADPLLDEYREECRRKAEGEGHETKRNYTDVGCGWAKRRVRGRRRRRDGNLWGDGRVLLGDLPRDGGMLFEAIHHFVCGVDCQVFLYHQPRTM
jgi:hypothetical protein